MANHPQILITVTGMGDPMSGDTAAWAESIFPDGVLEKSGKRSWIRSGNKRVFLIEVRYEDFSDAVLEKFEGMRRLVPDAVPDSAEKVLGEYAGDVCTNVFVKDALDAAQRRFVDAYSEAIRIAIQEKTPGTDTRNARLGVLCHSLGTLIAYEGLHAASRSPFIATFLSANLVLCAPMLSPISKVQSFAGQNRHLTRFGCRKPANGATIGRCFALYDRSDPFHLIQQTGYYQPSSTNQLVDKYLEFDSKPGVRFWEGHSMEGSYLLNNRHSIADFLLT